MPYLVARPKPASQHFFILQPSTLWDSNESKYQILLADSDGNVSETNTAKNLEIKLAGYSKRMNDEQMNDNFIKLATYNALTNMLPQLDPELLKLPHSSTKTIAGANI